MARIFSNARRLLADDGYQGIASHPNVAAFWNRVNAYRRIGFRNNFV